MLCGTNEVRSEILSLQEMLRTVSYITNKSRQVAVHCKPFYEIPRSVINSWNIDWQWKEKFRWINRCEIPEGKYSTRQNDSKYTRQSFVFLFFLNVALIRSDQRISISFVNGLLTRRELNVNGYALLDCLGIYSFSCYDGLLPSRILNNLCKNLKRILPGLGLDYWTSDVGSRSYL